MSRSSRAAALVVLLVLVLAVAGCGLSTGQAATHSTPAKPRQTHKLRAAGWCAFHGWRAVEDLHHNHPGWGAFQIWRALSQCKRVVR